MRLNEGEIMAKWPLLYLVLLPLLFHPRGPLPPNIGGFRNQHYHMCNYQTATSTTHATTISMPPTIPTHHLWLPFDYPHCKDNSNEPIWAPAAIWTNSNEWPFSAIWTSHWLSRTNLLVTLELISYPPLWFPHHLCLNQHNKACPFFHKGNQSRKRGRNQTLRQCH